MSNHERTGIEEGVEAAVEGVKGRLKEAAGALVGDRDLADEGSAQQDKANAQKEAAKNEARAEKERAAADLHEQRQRTHQDG
ncbi:microaggregate-binding protein 1 [Nocardia vaccinii]|uniref:microaggregate-binding protein 1 n=1 Tax=Nocardia vaccinii TaxID=1822 RepID=UPI00082E117E|nr:CsbD family protein [Nocardia vaccinii]